MLMIKALSSGLGSILAGERRTSKIWIVHQYRAIMGMWKYIYVSTYTEKQEYGQFVTYSFTLLYLCTFHFWTWSRNHIQIELSCLFITKFWGENVQQREMFSHSSTFSECIPPPLHAELSTWWFSCLFVFYPCFNLSFPSLLGFPDGSDGKESACNVGDLGSVWVWKIPERREWLPTPVFLPRELYGQRSVAATVHGVTKSWTQLSD